MTVTPSTEETNEQFVKYLPYLNELRGVLFTTIGIYIIGFIIGFVCSPRILVFLMSFFTLDGIDIVMTSPFQYLNLTLTTSSLVAFVIALPYLVVRLFLFARPGLRKNEANVILSILPWSIILFILGFAAGMYITQIIITFYAKTQIGFEVNNLWDIQRFFAQVLFTSLVMGLIFQIPLLLRGCIRLGLVKKSTLLSQRKYIYGGLLVVAALLPTTDLVSLAVISLMLILLFEGSLLLNR